MQETMFAPSQLPAGQLPAGQEPWAPGQPGPWATSPVQAVPMPPAPPTQPLPTSTLPPTFPPTLPPPTTLPPTLPTLPPPTMPGPVVAVPPPTTMPASVAPSPTGTEGWDRLLDLPGNTSLICGPNQDIVAFRDGSGFDRVYNFDASDSGDVIVFRAGINGSGITAEEQIRVDDAPGGAMIDLGGGNCIQLMGVQAAQLDPSDFAVLAAGV